MFLVSLVNEITLTGQAQPSSQEVPFRDPLPQGDFTRDDS